MEEDQDECDHCGELTESNTSVVQTNTVLTFWKYRLQRVNEELDPLCYSCLSDSLTGDLDE